MFRKFIRRTTLPGLPTFREDDVRRHVTQRVLFKEQTNGLNARLDRR